MKSDAARVADFMQDWGLEADGIRLGLLALLAEVRQEATIAAVPMDPKGVEAAAAKVLAEMAPPGTPVTPELLTRVRSRIREVVEASMVEAGMSSAQAMAMSALLVGTMKLKEKT